MVEWREARENRMFVSFFGWKLKKGHPVFTKSRKLKFWSVLSTALSKQTCIWNNAFCITSFLRMLRDGTERVSLGQAWGFRSEEIDYDKQLWLLQDESKKNFFINLLHSFFTRHPWKRAFCYNLCYYWKTQWRNTYMSKKWRQTCYKVPRSTNGISGDVSDSKIWRWSSSCKLKKK